MLVTAKKSNIPTIFDTLFNEFGLSSDTFVKSEGFFKPLVNTREDDNAYYAEIDLPGIDKNDINIEIKDNDLIISGEKKFKNEVKKDDYYKIESSYGKFVRKFALPKNVDLENIKAESKNGVLEVVIPKQEEKSNVKKIEVK